jgi:hypothetical protein
MEAPGSIEMDPTSTEITIHSITYMFPEDIQCPQNFGVQVVFLLYKYVLMMIN